MEFMFVVIIVLWFLGGFATLLISEFVSDKAAKPTVTFLIFMLWPAMMLAVLISGFVKSGRVRNPSDN